MSFLSDLNQSLSVLGIPLETGIFKDKAPSLYLVITPMNDVFDLFADNIPGMDIHNARISLFSTDNATALNSKMTRILLDGGYTVTYRNYNGYDTQTGYHQWTTDVAKENEYTMEDS